MPVVAAVVGTQVVVVDMLVAAAAVGKQVEAAVAERVEPE